MSIDCQHISIGYEKPLFTDINVRIDAQGLMALVGPNGIGKSTLLKTMAGLLPTLAGEVIMDGKKLSQLSNHERAKRVAFVSSRIGSTGFMTVREYVSLGRTPYLKQLGKLHAIDKEKINKAIEQVGVMTLAERKVSSLSDGERQKASIARALAQDTRHIILDEPTAFLDLSAKVSVLKLLKELAVEKAILYSTHDISLAGQLAEKLLVLSPTGLQSGTPSKMLDSGSLDAVIDARYVKVSPNDFRIIIC